MRQSGHYSDDAPLEENGFRSMLARRIEELDIDSARSDIERFLVDPSTVRVWSREFFLAVAEGTAIQSYPG